MPANATYFLVPDLPGMGDNLFTMHFGLIGKDIWNGMQTVTTLEQAKKIIKSYYRISNGMPFCIFTLSLTTYDDIKGWQELCHYANEHNGHMGFYTSLNYAWSYPYNSCGRFYRNASDESKSDADFIPEFARSLNPSGEWKLCWDQGVYNRLYGVSVANLWKHKNQQSDKNLLITIAEEYIKHWGINSVEHNFIVIGKAVFQYI